MSSANCAIAGCLNRTKNLRKESNCKAHGALVKTFTRIFSQLPRSSSTRSRPLKFLDLLRNSEIVDKTATTRK